MTTVPCRLYVILAREAPVGVIFRRGPSNRVQIIRWNTADDTFEPGHWFKGRIYEHHCDVTPDGTKLVYFASKQARKWNDNLFESFRYWTAVSKVPYLTALALWPKRDTYHGGGVFSDNHTLLLNHYYNREPLPSLPIPEQLHVQMAGSLETMGNSVLYWRLQNDGWQMVQNYSAYLPTEEGMRWDKPIIWRRTTKNKRYALMYTDYGTLRGGGDFIAYHLWRRDTGEETLLPDVTWADWDQQRRLVFAREGKLFSASPPDFEERELADFNANRYKPLPPPEWATRWD